MLNSQPLGFYSSSQLVQDAQRHGVTVLPVDVTVSEGDCTLSIPPPSGVQPALECTSRGRGKDIFEDSARPQIRLGLRMVAQLSTDAAERIVSARNQSPFTDIADLQRRAELTQQDIEALAAADAFHTLIGHRRDALWDALGLNRDSRLFTAPIDPGIPSLIPPTEADNIVADFRALGLSLRRHPVALLRPALAAQRISSAEDVKNARHGQLIRTTGLVTCRQRPGTAKGTTFVTLEDETGYVNVVVWSHVAARQRNPLILARLMCVAGRVERQGEVVHLIAGRLIDQTSMLGDLDFHRHEFH